ncbi:HAD family hydrolase [Gemmata sp. G18]|uniref:HAD family hydrolase n=1 Tax=Gemmata palustris TaxID=2822762 RepID=A0ABS5BKY4_9BACT|nr:HAD family hydrolase [Gemmata palustris]MBP3954330.1 HAD family hydrolase [Gemmata palustris]
MPIIPVHARAIFFDAVGTLLFPEPSAPAVYADTARRYGLQLAPGEVRSRFVAAYRVEEAADVATSWATSEARERERWHRIVTQTLTGVSDPEACYRDLFDHFALPAAWRVAPDAAEVLTALQSRGLMLGMGSNYDARLWPVLGGFPELAARLDHVVISAAVGVRKPGGGFFREVTRVANCALNEVLFVGDDLENDYTGATAAGMHAVLLDPRADHAHIPHRITDLGELLH